LDTRSLVAKPYPGSIAPQVTTLLARQATHRPDDIAAVCGDESMTYRDLVRASRRFAARLGTVGVAADDCVGLYAEPSLDLLVGLWGTLFAGGAYLPLSPEYPEERVRYMIDDSRARVVVTQRRLAAQLTELVPPGTRIVVVEETGDDLGQLDATPSPQSLAYVIYTSGSTGRPKGVMVEHHSIASQLRWLHDCGHLGNGTTILQKTPMSFDAAQWELLAPAVGARVVMGAPGIYRDPEALVAAIVRHDVTTLQCVPTLLQALLDTEELQSCVTLRRVFSGGEALSWQLARRFAAELPFSSLVNLYGPTECTINATAYLIDAEAIGEGSGTVPIGVPVDNTQCYILDQDMMPVEIGETGELYIGGNQLARGYLHRPDQTQERFIGSPFMPTERLYKTGDVAYWNPDGTIQFVGRVDNQVKLRGYRVELDEINLAIEDHTWVKHAAVVMTDDPRTHHPSLVACVELNPKEAALMDQGSHGAHHQSKKSRLQVKAQLGNPGLRDAGELLGRPVIELPGRQETQRQRERVFARKTYRFFDGGPVTEADLVALLAPRPAGEPRRSRTAGSRTGEVGLPELGEILRWFGQFHSHQRLLPKYSYASPGALYATQLYLEANGAGGLPDGTYYYHPVDHTLVRVGPGRNRPEPVLLHFIGKRRAIEPVYKNNIREVLEMETGHMIGVLDDVLPEFGLHVRPHGYDPTVRDQFDVADEDYYLGSFEFGERGDRAPEDATEIYLQVHPGRVAGLTAGQYRWVGGELVGISDELVLPKHVIAINQQVYERASFGVAIVSRTSHTWLEYINLGTKLHHLQRNGLGLGLMSSGYSSKTGHPLPAAQRIDDILARCGFEPGASYFALGGKVSAEQIASDGMREDTVHMQGPAEMIKDELSRRLPHYMVPNRVVVLDRLPLNANGKVDNQALATLDAVTSDAACAPYVPPATPSEKWLAAQWAAMLGYDSVSVEDEFFAAGGNSLVAVTLINRINREFGTQLPLQVLFESPKLGDLAARIGTGTGQPNPQPSSRLVRLHGDPAGRPVFCWPGLGGYPMNLRRLGSELDLGRPFYGIQAYGLNDGETPYQTIRDMAAADVAEIRRVQPEGPYTLWGYSFGARVAFEAAWQLQQSGQQVDSVLLLCPGNPRVPVAQGQQPGRRASYDNPAYVAILFSVFAGTVDGPELAECLRTVHDEQSFVSFVNALFPTLDAHLIRRIVRIVQATYQFEYRFDELVERQLGAPVQVFKAAHDDYSFLDRHSGFSAAPPRVVELAGDHYAVLKDEGVAELAAAIRAGLDGPAATVYTC